MNAAQGSGSYVVKPHTSCTPGSMRATVVARLNKQHNAELKTSTILYAESGSESTAEQLFMCHYLNRCDRQNR
jgi:hypothetical protein